MNTSSNSATASLSAAEIAAKRAALAAEMEMLANAEKQMLEAEHAKVAETVNSIPALLGVESLDAAVALIRSVQKGTYGKLDAAANAVAARKVPVVLSDAQKAKIVERLKVGGPGNQLSELAKEFDVSTGTVFGLKKTAGLVVARDSSAPAAPAPAADASAPAA